VQQPVTATFSSWVCRAALLLAGAASPVVAAEATVKPGSVVRWSAPGIERCELEGRTFLPRRDGDETACFLPVDLLATGTLRATRVVAGKAEELSLRVGDYPYAVQRLTITDTRRIDPEPADLERIERESARVTPLWKLDGPPRAPLPLGSPLEKPPAAGRFGAKRILNGQPRSPHGGADYSANQGTPVLAAADGEVKLAEEHFFSGNAIYLDHGDGLLTMYFHLHEIFVKPGQQVTRGAVIGTVGSTGRSTGPHLHFAVRWRDARVDPALLLQPVERLPAR
jgi:murein DD-endopeptidase MepM/ murein hydrolase activator NlpD